MTRPDLRLVVSNGERLDVELPPGNPPRLACFVVYLGLAMEAYEPWREFQETLRGSIHDRLGIQHKPLQDKEHRLPMSHVIVAREDNLTTLGRASLASQFSHDEELREIESTIKPFSRRFSEEPSHAFAARLEGGENLWGISFNQGVPFEIYTAVMEKIEDISGTEPLLTGTRMPLGVIEGDLAAISRSVGGAFAEAKRNRQLPSIRFNPPKVVTALAD